MIQDGSVAMSSYIDRLFSKDGSNMKPRFIFK